MVSRVLTVMCIAFASTMVFSTLFPFWTLKQQSSIFPRLWYTIKWRNIRPIQISNCTSCKFSPKNDKSNSSPRDLILSAAFESAPGIVPFVRSLRTTECKAELYIFLDQSAYLSLSNETIQTLENCGANLINIGTLKNINRVASISLRYIVYFDFLENRKEMYDRVLAIDLYDVVFQGDPFTSEMANSSLYFAKTPITIDKCPLNIQWLAEIEGIYDVKVYSGKPLLSSSSIAGGISEFITFIKYYVKNAIPDDLQDMRFVDQGFINKFYYRDLLGDMVKLWDEPFLNVKDATELLKFGEIMKGEIYPKVIHQYDKSRAHIGVYLMCPRIDKNQGGYIRDLSIDSMNDLDKRLQEIGEEPIPDSLYI